MDNFLIKRNNSNSSWKRFINYLNERFSTIFGGNAFNYYGIINGKAEATDYPSGGVRIITLEEWEKETEEEKFVLPDRWCVKGCKEVIDWFNLKTNSKYYNGMSHIWHFCYPNTDNGDGYKVGYHLTKTGTEITLEQFLKHVVKKEIMQKQTISRKNLLTLYKGSTCDDWRNRIKIYLVNSATENEDFTMEINDDDLQYAIENATTSQKALIKTIGVELVVSKSVDLTSRGAETGNDVTVKGTGLPVEICIRSGAEFAKTSFYLDEAFDWELKRDSSNTLCLIPTKK